MACCGKQYLVETAGSAAPPAARAASTAGRTSTAGQGAGDEGVVLRYLGDAAVRVRGTASGQVYRVSRERPMVRVDGRDARALLRSGLFGS
jgi:hypothetical protein